MTNLENDLAMQFPDAPILAAALASLARGSPSDLAADLALLDGEVPIAGTKVRSHCYFVRIDANGQPRTERLIEHICRAVMDYTIPRSAIDKAFQEYLHNGSTSYLARLGAEAKRLFVDLSTTGEGGELLLFLLAERALRIPQIICKMSLKTSKSMHYHGADGVHAELDEATGILSLYWCESKMHANSTRAITECFKSLAPYLLQPDATDADRDQDIMLLQRQVDLNDPLIDAAIRRYFDHDAFESSKVKYCGLALVAFNSDAYPVAANRAVQDQVHSAVSASLGNIRAHIGKRIIEEKLSTFDIHVLCVPFPSVDNFRAYFLKQLAAQ